MAVEKSDPYSFFNLRGKEIDIDMVRVYEGTNPHDKLSGIILDEIVRVEAVVLTKRHSESSIPGVDVAAFINPRFNNVAEEDQPPSRVVWLSDSANRWSEVSDKPPEDPIEPIAA